MKKWTREWNFSVKRNSSKTEGSWPQRRAALRGSSEVRRASREHHEVRNPWYLTYPCNSNTSPETSHLKDTHICWIKTCVFFCSVFHVRQSNSCVILMRMFNLIRPLFFVYVEINFNLLSDSNFSLTQAELCLARWHPEERVHTSVLLPKFPNTFYCPQIFSLPECY